MDVAQSVNFEHEDLLNCEPANELIFEPAPELPWVPLEAPSEEVQRLPEIHTTEEFLTSDQSRESNEEGVGDPKFGEDDESTEGAPVEEIPSDHIIEALASPSQLATVPQGESIGVTYHKKNKQWEAHLWFKGYQLQGRRKKGMQVFLGTFDTEKEAKVAHDRAAIKLNVQTRTWGRPHLLNFPEAEQATFLAEHADWTPRDFLWKIRRFSSKFTKGMSSLKGVTVRKRLVKRSQEWAVTYEAKISFTAKQSGDDKKQTYMLGSFATEEEAGQNYDLALLYLHKDLLEVEQLKCITNYRPSSYLRESIEAMKNKLNLNLQHEVDS